MRMVNVRALSISHKICAILSMEFDPAYDLVRLRDMIHENKLISIR